MDSNIEELEVSFDELDYFKSKYFALNMLMKNTHEKNRKRICSPRTGNSSCL
jgi:hypothetical protein